MKPLVVAATLLALSTATAAAQRPPPGEGEDKSQDLGGGLYSLNWGTMGLNVGVSTGADGILLVDAQEVGAVPRLLTEIAKRSDKAVRVVIDSHWHFDHVGANEYYRQHGATIIAQENTRTRLMSEQINPLGGKQAAFPPSFWPTLTFADALAMHFNGYDIDVVHVPSGHTDGDVIVRFRQPDVLFAADLFNNGDYTRVDLRGGSLDGMIAAYQKLLPTLDDQVKVVPGRRRGGDQAGHGELSYRHDRAARAHRQAGGGRQNRGRGRGAQTHRRFRRQMGQRPDPSRPDRGGGLCRFKAKGALARGAISEFEFPGKLICERASRI